MGRPKCPWRITRGGVGARTGEFDALGRPHPTPNGLGLVTGRDGPRRMSRGPRQNSALIKAVRAFFDAVVGIADDGEQLHEMIAGRRPLIARGALDEVDQAAEGVLDAHRADRDRRRGSAPRHHRDWRPLLTGRREIGVRGALEKADLRQAHLGLVVLGILGQGLAVCRARPRIVAPPRSRRRPPGSGGVPRRLGRRDLDPAGDAPAAPRPGGIGPRSRGPRPRWRPRRTSGWPGPATNPWSPGRTGRAGSAAARVAVEVDADDLDAPLGGCGNVDHGAEEDDGLGQALGDQEPAGRDPDRTPGRSR